MVNPKSYQTICVVNMYFGKLPNYFKLWLNSCKYNETIDFLIFTDDRNLYEYPKNVKVIYTTFNDIKQHIQKYFDFKISLKYTYKLCDYKPIIGYIFQEYLNGYDFWGNCDFDTIFGDLRKFLDEDILKNNDKIYVAGHFTLYKNEKRINENFKEMINKDTNKLLYQEVFTDNSSHYFDEWSGIINLYDGNKYKLYQNKDAIADISIKYNNLIVTNRENDGNYIFKWCKENKQSKLYGIYIKNNKIERQEFMYIHLQKRYMEVYVNNETSFLIVPNKFIEIHGDDEEKNAKIYSKKMLIYKKEYIQLRIKRILQKIFRKGKKTI